MENSFYKWKQLGEGVFHIQDLFSDYMYLVVGEEKAALIDTGMGFPGLRQLVERLTDKPVIVLNTHGHLDHIGGNDEFGCIYLHPDDLAVYAEHGMESYRSGVIRDMARELGVELSKEIREAVEKYAIVAGEAKDFYAYEVDGFGQYNVMDDANLPSLLAMPYIGYCDKENERYQNTRGMVLSERNSYYFPGKVLTGIGSQHTDTRYVWSMSLCMQGITSDDKEEKEAIFKMLENSDGGTNLMHESIFADDDTKYTRPWFSWANSVFCEFVMDYLGYSVKLH